MSKIAAIDTAVRLRIAADGKKIDLTEPLNVAQRGYADANAVSDFLLGVSRNLKLDTPPLLFKWSCLNATDLFSKQLHVVIGYIAENTKVAER